MEEFFGKIAAGDDVDTAAKATDAKLNTRCSQQVRQCS